MYPSKDSYISESGPNNNYGSLTFLNLGDDGTSKKYRVLFHFDVSALSAGGTVKLYISIGAIIGDDASGRTYRISRLTQTGWTEAGVTWNKYDGSTAWTAAGGDYTDTGAIDFTGPSATGWVEVDISTLVDDAINNRADQLHIIIRDTGSEASIRMIVNSKEEPGTTIDPYVATPTANSVTETVASVTETITEATQSFDYSIANNNQAYILNLQTGYWTFQDNCPVTNAIYRPSTQQIIGSRRDVGQITRLDYGSTFDGTDIDSVIKTGDMNFGNLDEVTAMDAGMSEAIKKLRALFSEVIGEGDLTFKVYSETDTSGTSFTITVPTTDNSTLNIIRTALSRNLKGKYYAFEIANNSGDDFWFGETKIKIIPKAIR